MLRKPVKILANANIMEAVDLILYHRISGICVVDEADNLIGICSELDCLRAMISATYNESGLGPVSDCMTKDNLRISSLDCDILDVAQEMLEHHMRRKPVVADGKLVGLITCRQLLKAVKNFTR